MQLTYIWIYTTIRIYYKFWHFLDTQENVHFFFSKKSKYIWKVVKSGKELSPRGLFYYAKELSYNKRYDDAIKYFNKFLNSEKDELKTILEPAINFPYAISLQKNLKSA